MAYGCRMQSTCDVNARCTDLLGYFMCQCKAGFSGNGTSCLPGLPSKAAISGKVSPAFLAWLFTSNVYKQAIETNTVHRILFVYGWQETRSLFFNQRYKQIISLSLSLFLSAISPCSLISIQIMAKHRGCLRNDKDTGMICICFWFRANILLPVTHASSEQDSMFSSLSGILGVMNFKIRAVFRVSPYIVTRCRLLVIRDMIWLRKNVSFCKW